MRKGLNPAAPPGTGIGTPPAVVPAGVATTMGVQRAMLAPEEARGTGALGPPGDPPEESDSLPESLRPASGARKREPLAAAPPDLPPEPELEPEPELLPPLLPRRRLCPLPLPPALRAAVTPVLGPGRSARPRPMPRPAAGADVGFEPTPAARLPPRVPPRMWLPSPVDEPEPEPKPDGIAYPQPVELAGGSPSRASSGPMVREVMAEANPPAAAPIKPSFFPLAAAAEARRRISSSCSAARADGSPPPLAAVSSARPGSSEAAVASAVASVADTAAWV